MEIKDDRHFDIYPNGSPAGDDSAASEEVVIDTKRGIGEARPRIEHQTLCGDESSSASQVMESGGIEDLGNAPTQEFQTGDMPAASAVKADRPSFPRDVPSVNPTMQFFLTGRVRVDTDGATDTSRGRLRAKTFLGLGDAPKAISDQPSTSLVDIKRTTKASDRRQARESFATKHAKLALMRTVNFLSYLILKSPENCRESLEQRKNDLVVPRHLPGDDEIYRIEYYARSIGYYGPVLWFIPPNMTLDDLVSAGILSEAWWRREPNFPEGFKTLSPFDPPLGEKDYREPGYWVLAIPGVLPGTTAKTFSEQEASLPYIARTFGLEVENGCIHPKHRMIMAVRGVVDILYFCAIAEHAKERLTNLALTARTANIVKTYHEEPKSSRGTGIRLPAQSLHSVCRACVDFPADRQLSISDIVDDRPSQGVGLIVFIIPTIYE